MSNVSTDLSDTVSKLVELTKQLADAKSDIKILNQEEKRLKERVKKSMGVFKVCATQPPALSLKFMTLHMVLGGNPEDLASISL